MDREWERTEVMTTTNGVTNAILSALQYMGACAMRNNTVGVYDNKTKSYRTGHPSALGSGDILACIGGRWLEIEIKVGSDRMSFRQRARKERVERAGGLYWMVHGVDQFLKLMEENNLRLR
jgi:hypothetical protein